MDKGDAIELRNIARRNRLNAVQRFWDAPDSEIKTDYNGVGPNWLPECIRNDLNGFMTLALPAVVIHDFDYTNSAGTRNDFDMANDRLYYNILKLAANAFPWYNPLTWLQRLRWIATAAAAYRACDAAGWPGYLECAKKNGNVKDPITDIVVTLTGGKS